MSVQIQRLDLQFGHLQTTARVEGIYGSAVRVGQAFSATILLFPTLVNQPSAIGYDERIQATCEEMMALVDQGVNPCDPDRQRGSSAWIEQCSLKRLDQTFYPSAWR